MEFSKYISQGAYHWDATMSSLIKHVAFTAGRYEIVVRQPVNWKSSLVLDIACGDGRLAAFVAVAGARFVLGVDLSRIGMIAGLKRWAKKQPHSLHRGGFAQADYQALPTATGTFDVVIAAEIIEHVPDPRMFLSKVVQPLKTNGTLIITTPYRLTEQPLDQHHVHEYYPEKLKMLMKEFFSEVNVTLSHPVWITSLYSLRGLAWPFRLLVNALSVLGHNPFLRWPLGRYAAQITLLGKGRRA